MPARARSPDPGHLLAARIAHGLTQREAGLIVGAPARTWQDWERGQRAMPAIAWHCWRYWVWDLAAPPLPANPPRTAHATRAGAKLLP